MTQPHDYTPRDADGAPATRPPDDDAVPTTRRPDDTVGHLPSDVKPAGRFEILSELGRGGMGVVYKARQVGLGRECALKLLLQGKRATEEERVRFQREGAAAARIAHPNVVQVFEVGELD